MKSLFLGVTVMFTLSATSVMALPVKLKCWDVKAVNSTEPLMIVDMPNEHLVKSVTFNVSPSSVYQYLPRNLGANGNQIYYGSKIENRRSPYFGNMEYMLLEGSLRLVLTPDTSDLGLKMADVDGRKEGHAAILQIAQQMHRNWSGGDIYVRFRCTK